MLTQCHTLAHVLIGKASVAVATAALIAQAGSARASVAVRITCFGWRGFGMGQADGLLCPEFQFVQVKMPGYTGSDC